MLLPCRALLVSRWPVCCTRDLGNLALAGMGDNLQCVLAVRLASTLYRCSWRGWFVRVRVLAACICSALLFVPLFCFVIGDYQYRVWIHGCCTADVAGDALLCIMHNTQQAVHGCSCAPIACCRLHVVNAKQRIPQHLRGTDTWYTPEHDKNPRTASMYTWIDRELPRSRTKYENTPVLIYGDVTRPRRWVQQHACP